MNAKELITTRRSIRKYTDEIVNPELMNQIMEMTKFAPSWCNFQVARYTFVTNPETISSIMENGVHGFTYNVKTLKYAKNIAILSYVTGKSGKLDLRKDEYTTSKDADWEMFDAGIACQTFCLSAHAHGIATCVMGVIDDSTISEIINLPEGETVAAVIAYGHPNEEVEPTPRKSIDDITRYIK